MAEAPTRIDNRSDDADELTYYPAFCHKASPTYFAWAKLGITDVYRLKSRWGFEGQNLYFYNNHPIQFLCLSGVIVARDEQLRRTILMLDDSTGATIEVVCDRPDPQQLQAQHAEVRPAKSQIQAAKQKSISEQILAEDEKGAAHIAAATRTPLDISSLEPGVVAKLRGPITRFRGMFQLHLERYVLVPDTNAEVRFWEERTRFLVDVLCVPWVLSGAEVERLRRECEEEDVQRLKRKRVKEKKVRYIAEKHAEQEESYRLRIERRYAKEEVTRRKLAAECAEASRRFVKTKKVR